MPFCANLLGLATIHQSGFHSLPRIHRAFSATNQNFTLPVHSFYQIVATQMSLSPFFPKFLTSASALSIFLASSCSWCLFQHLMHRYFVGLSTPLRFDVSFRLFSDLREIFTVLPFFHQTVITRCILQSYKYLFSLLLHCLCSSSSIAPSFASSSVFSLPSVTNFLKMRHFLLFYCAVCLDMLHFH